MRYERGSDGVNRVKMTAVVHLTMSEYHRLRRMAWDQHTRPLEVLHRVAVAGLAEELAKSEAAESKKVLPKGKSSDEAAIEETQS